MQTNHSGILNGMRKTASSHMAAWLLASLPGLTPIAVAIPVPLWQIGDDEDPYASGYQPTDEFSSESGSTNSAPGHVTRLPADPAYSATSNPSRDDHFYQAGTYPAGFNSLTSPLSVPYPEPAAAFERALTNDDPTNRIHFILSAAQAGPLSRIRLTLELVEGGSWSQTTSNGDNFGSHDITIRFRTATTNTIILQRPGVDRDTRFTIDIPASSVQAAAGANTIQITRTGPTPAAGVYPWIQFDFVKMEVDVDGMADGDSDGLPRWWENDNRLSDSDASDAATDHDGDGLTALQEYNGGMNSCNPRNRDTDGDGANDAVERTAASNPNLADTDGDSLKDGDELLVNPVSSPLLTDSDSDGAPDAWEKRVGSNPGSAASVPSSFAGAIGFNFVSSAAPNGTFPWLSPAGVVPQLNWNHTIPLRTYNRPSGGTVDLSSPVAGAVSRSDGQLIPGMSIQWTSEDSYASFNDGSPDQKLMSGFLRADDNTPVSLNVQGIPFLTYHVFAYVGAASSGQRASVNLNGEAATVRNFIASTAPPNGKWIEIVPSPAISEPIANFVRYPNRTGTTFTVNVSEIEGWSVGLHALQIVDANLDADASGIPDWYEMLHALQPAGPASATADPDGDGLSNLQEFQRGSNPRKSDTDGDALPDGTESAANSLSMDGDGDGLGDYDEVNAPLPGNPSLADSDGDGLGDKQESELGLDPGTNPSSDPNFIGWTPLYSASPKKWEWKIEPVQLVWDHGGGATGGNDGDEQDFLSIFVSNAQPSSGRSLNMRLITIDGAITYQFESRYGEAFSGSNQPSNHLYLDDDTLPPADLKGKLGFSGYGPADVSDRLRFRMLATRATGNSWSIAFEIFNVTRGTVVVSRLVSQTTAASNVDNGTATWTNGDGFPGLPAIEVHQGCQVFISPTPLETRPSFAAFADADNDGMPDAWEDTYQLDKNSATDAGRDADDDGLTNLEECLAGTHPRLVDTDGDGADDRVEREEGSDPLSAGVLPPFARSASTTGSDFNLNGLSDAWEAHYQTNALSPSADDDGDGASNAKESSWGTDPHDASSRVALALQRDGNDAVLSWTKIARKNQRLHRTTDFQSWQWLSLPTTNSGGNSLARVMGQFTSARSAFFAVDTQDKDSDGDGVADWDENFVGSNPLKKDSVRSGSLALDHQGNVTGSVSGDYASFSSRFRNSLPGGPGGPVTREQAARFLQQATFGPTMVDLARLQTLGFAGWLDEQIANRPATLQRPYIESIYADLRGPRLDLSYNNDGEQHVGGANITSAFARGAIAGEDQLRQRVAFALSQILVVSRRDANLADRPLGLSGYYDIFLRHALGSYKDILTEVTLHPAMGRYLSHVGNQKARPEINQFPDENYAREMMQLFTIGLWELNQDGTRKMDAGGNFIPTYNNGDITEIARVFTGLWFGGQQWSDGGYEDDHYTVPMTMWPEKHDFGAKEMLGSLSIPTRSASAANGLRDVEDTIDFLFKHPNTAPFVSRQLIQFLVTSNPSPSYVGRIAAVFSNNGNGGRGDLAAVVRAILLDVEARDVRWSQGSESFGRLKDPVQRTMAIARAGRLARFPGVNWWDYGDFYEAALQSPGNSPSVFNFYRPDYRPPGLLTDNQLAGPSFQITNSYSSISFVNQVWRNSIEGLRLYDQYSFQPDYKDLLEVAEDPTVLMDRANLLFCGGMMTAATRKTILKSLNRISDQNPLLRVQLAVFLASACPEGAVQR